MSSTNRLKEKGKRKKRKEKEGKGKKKSDTPKTWKHIGPTL